MLVALACVGFSGDCLHLKIAELSEGGAYSGIAVMTTANTRFDPNARDFWPH